MSQSGDVVRVNGRSYHKPVRPTVVVCLDGSDPSYLEEALAHQRTPTLARWRAEGTWLTASAVVPTFTNPNNVSILTGAPPSVHGISGNYFYDPSLGQDVPMNDRAYLRAPTILDALAKAGVRVAAVTAKEKLRRLITPVGTTEGGIAFSVEEPGVTGRALVSRAPPSIYSEDASLYALDAGIRILERGLAQLVYISTTDYIQHKHAPSTPEAHGLYGRLDARFERLGALGACVAVTADHGMNGKARGDGSPNVVYLEDLLKPVTRPGDLHVTLPITDPYVVHHGALGSCAMIYLSGHIRQIEPVRDTLLCATGVECVLDRLEAAHAFELPPDRIGDLMVLASRDAVLGRAPDHHDLSHVEKGLRSHGGLHERAVPLIINRPLSPSFTPGGGMNLVATGHDLRNFDVFDLALNGTR